MKPSRIPVHLVTGFLGSGKTTFVNHLIQSLPQERILVIENEVGKVNIDGGLISRQAFDVEELTAGCLCCSLNSELIDVLQRIQDQANTFDRLIVETTGIADPEPVILPFLSHPAIEASFELIHTICVVDAENIEDWLQETDEAKKQLISSDILLINKADLVQPHYLRDLVGLLQGLNPLATTLTGSQGRFEARTLLDILPHREKSDSNFLPREPIASAKTSHGISTFTLVFDRPFRLQSLSHELWKLLVVSSHQIYRIKGLILAESYPVPVILQSVRRQLIITDSESKSHESAMTSRIVVIGKNLKKEPLERLFSRHLIPAN
jgi:G3E family GTPase